MRTIDLSPLYRTSVGFDRMGQLLDSMLASDGASAPSYPPYNIEKLSDDAYRISIAVAGFAEEDLGIESKDGELIVTGGKSAKPDAEAQRFLHRGIAERAFERRFKLADHVRATGAQLRNGLLHIELVREVPDALKPRRIAIGAAETSSG